MRYWLVLYLWLTLAWPAMALKSSGNLAAEFLLFPQSAQFSDQMDENVTLSFQPKFSHEWNQGKDLLSAEFFLRMDNKDENREHADIRELKWLHVSGDNEWRVGIDTVFWGVTESRHLVDVINQTDRLEGFDGEDKLGQPMLQYTHIMDAGVFHFFMLAGFREPEFRGSKGRLRLPLLIDASQSLYESSDQDEHIDFALRYTHFTGDTELGFSVFNGTDRDPLFLPGLDNNGNNVLIPFYQQMTQFGFDVQSIIGDWTWKLELIHRDGNSDTFTAATGGFEYTLYGILETAVDLGTLLEYSAEDREENEAIFDNDLFGGLRFAFNDVQSTEILAGMIVDTEKSSKSFRVEASRRIGDNWKLTGELQVFTDVESSDPLVAFSQDDYLLVEFARYY